MAWSLKGQLIESCSCNMFCPCWFAVQDLMVMDRGWCAGVIGMSVDEGSADGVDLSGRTVAIEIYFPGPTLFDGNATARVFIDDGVSDEQRAELEPILQGARGGAMEPIAGLVSQWLPTQVSPVSISDDGDKVTVSVGGTGEMTSTLLRDPEGNQFTLRGGGFVGGFGLEEAHLAPTASRWCDEEMPSDAYDALETKSGARGAYAWSG